MAEKMEKSGICKVCGINLYVERGDCPSAIAMPCGINRLDIPEVYKESEKVMCPYETEKEQKFNFEKHGHDISGGGEQIIYLGGIDIS